MRTNQSLTASGIYSCFGISLEPLPESLVTPLDRGAIHIQHPTLGDCEVPASHLVAGPGSTFLREAPARQENIAEGAGLLHDARNLMGAVYLYCDLLSQNGVLKQEHLHYAKELEQLCSRSHTLMERLLLSLPNIQNDVEGMPIGNCEVTLFASPASKVGAGQASLTLRQIVENCSGMLSRIAGGASIEYVYGPAASTPIAADREDVERILMNLVKNATAALDSRRMSPGGSEPTDSALRIGVGMLLDPIGIPRPWPFGRVRLTVEDSGCGMTSTQLEHLLQDSQAGSGFSRGLGFRIVKELVAAAGAELRMASRPGGGTKVQIEWPIEGIGLADKGKTIPILLVDRRGAVPKSQNSLKEVFPGLKPPKRELKPIRKSKAGTLVVPSLSLLSVLVDGKECAC